MSLSWSSTTPISAITSPFLCSLINFYCWGHGCCIFFCPYSYRSGAIPLSEALSTSALLTQPILFFYSTCDFTFSMLTASSNSLVFCWYHDSTAAQPYSQCYSFQPLFYCWRKQWNKKTPKNYPATQLCWDWDTLAALEPSPSLKAELRGSEYISTWGRSSLHQETGKGAWLLEVSFWVG